MIIRMAARYLDEWKLRPGRKPLVLRGARQVGKTHLATHWGSASFGSVVTVDLERERELHPVFDQSDPRKLLQELAVLKDQRLVPGESLLFLDEIQACPRALAALRYFHELVPELHVIAAGSLLDFALRDASHPMPVGRVEFLYLGPLAFGEFVRAVEGDGMAGVLEEYHAGDTISAALAGRLEDALRHYLFVGGMPEAVQAYADRASLVDVQRIQSSIVGTMEDDFAKYGSRRQPDLLRLALRHVARNVGRKIAFVNVAAGRRAAEVRAAFDLLAASRVVHLVHHSSANGVPLGAEVNEKRFKALFLDCGLANRLSGLPLVPADGLLTVNEGALAEQFAGQELLGSGLPFEDARLFYWHREARNANAEVDYVISAGAEVLPVEVKSAAGGALRSVFQFLKEKGRERAIRLYLGPAGEETLRVPGDGSRHVRVLSLPLYLAGQVRRLAAEWV
jgi:predicted AAA+ superfamily ATPase